MPDGTAPLPPLSEPIPLKPPPYKHLSNPRTEQALLGALLVQPALLQSLPPTFDPAHYADPAHADIHEAIVAVGKPGVPAALAVMQAIAVNDEEARGYIARLVGNAPSLQVGAVSQYAALVTDMHRRRKLVELSEAIRNGAFANGEGVADQTIARAMTGLDVLTTTGADRRPAVSLDDAVEAALRRADEAEGRDGPTGLGTGFKDIDDLIGGFEDGTLNIVAARPAIGKSSLGWQIAIHNARQGIGVCAISLEMSAAELGRRALSTISGVPLWVMKRGKHRPYLDRLRAAQKALQGLPLSIEDGGGLTAAQIGLKVRAAHRRHGVGLVMVDHLHIVRPEDADMRSGPTWAVGRISGAMKRLAKEHGCPVLLLAQLNRGVESRDDKRPGLADLRQSGDIEQDADTVGFLYRAEVYLAKEPERQPTDNAEKHANRITQWLRAKAEAAGKAELIYAKVRDGAPGTVNLTFRGETTSFGDAAYGE